MKHDLKRVLKWLAVEICAYPLGTFLTDVMDVLATVHHRPDRQHEETISGYDKPLNNIWLSLPT